MQIDMKQPILDKNDQLAAQLRKRFADNHVFVLDLLASPGSGKTSTIAVAIYQDVVRMSDGTAAALATILTLTTIISLVIVFRATKGKVKIV